MLLRALLLTTFVLHQPSGKEAKELSKLNTTLNSVEGKQFRDRYRYGIHDVSSNYWRGYNREHAGNRYRGDGGYVRDNHWNHHGVNRGARTGHHQHHQEHKLVPIKIPYLDQNGCRFVAEPVCDPAAAAGARTTWVRCLYANENKNLWKKPTFTVSDPLTCRAVTGGNVVQMISTELCNNNKRLLRAIGFIQEKDPKDNKYFHPSGMYFVNLNPCFLTS